MGFTEWWQDIEDDDQLFVLVVVVLAIGGAAVLIMVCWVLRPRYWVRRLWHRFYPPPPSMFGRDAKDTHSAPQIAAPSTPRPGQQLPAAATPSYVQQPRGHGVLVMVNTGAATAVATPNSNTMRRPASPTSYGSARSLHTVDSLHLEPQRTLAMAAPTSSRTVGTLPSLSASLASFHESRARAGTSVKHSQARPSSPTRAVLREPRPPAAGPPPAVVRTPLSAIAPPHGAKPRIRPRPLQLSGDLDNGADSAAGPSSPTVPAASPAQPIKSPALRSAMDVKAGPTRGDSSHSRSEQLAALHAHQLASAGRDKAAGSGRSQNHAFASPPPRIGAASTPGGASTSGSSRRHRHWTEVKEEARRVAVQEQLAQQQQQQQQAQAFMWQQAMAHAQMQAHQQAQASAWHMMHGTGGASQNPHAAYMMQQQYIAMQHQQAQYLALQQQQAQYAAQVQELQRLQSAHEQAQAPNQRRTPGVVSGAGVTTSASRRSRKLRPDTSWASAQVEAPRPVEQPTPVRADAAGTVVSASVVHRPPRPAQQAGAATGMASPPAGGTQEQPWTYGTPSERRSAVPSVASPMRLDSITPFDDDTDAAVMAPAPLWSPKAPVGRPAGRPVEARDPTGGPQRGESALSPVHTRESSAHHRANFSGASLSARAHVVADVPPGALVSPTRPTFGPSGGSPMGLA